MIGGLTNEGDELSDVNETENWMTLVHVREHALEKAILMVRAGRIPVEDHLVWAQRYWHFLSEGSVPLPAEMEIPDDVSGLVVREDQMDLPDRPDDLDEISAWSPLGNPNHPSYFDDGIPLPAEPPPWYPDDVSDTDPR